MSESPISPVNGRVNGKLSIIKWVLEKFGLPTLLIFVFLAFYAGVLPSPLTQHIDESNRMYRAVEAYLYEACRTAAKTAKDEDAISHCERIHVVYGVSRP